MGQNDSQDENLSTEKSKQIYQVKQEFELNIPPNYSSNYPWKLETTWSIEKTSCYRTRYMNICMEWIFQLFEKFPLETKTQMDPKIIGEVSKKTVCLTQDVCNDRKQGSTKNRPP